MSFVSERAEFEAESPLFALILSNSLVSQIPGVSGAGEDPESSLYVPPLDAELIINGELSGDLTPNTPTGCPTPATITLSMMDLIGMHPLMIAAGLNKPVMRPHMDLGESAGDDPRKEGYAVPNARALFERGRWLGAFLSQSHDLLVLGECLPGGTTTALCVLRALGYQAKVSSCLVNNPVK
ncbi:MAG TPA: TIGR00303 family protein, partial [Methanocorpusculum sp.]|nr:TIGR00303 family protein [Methanocorpusculum sp.]